jgi:hypothetical protein
VSGNASLGVDDRALFDPPQGFTLTTRIVRQQVRVMAYLDVSWVFAVMSLVALLLVLLMKKSVAKGGMTAH